MGEAGPDPLHAAAAVVVHRHAGAARGGRGRGWPGRVLPRGRGDGSGNRRGGLGGRGRRDEAADHQGGAHQGRGHRAGRTGGGGSGQALRAHQDGHLSVGRDDGRDHAALAAYQYQRTHSEPWVQMYSTV
ncbi:hypothetical protein CW362_21955 [Streptomyces populi]|uniref:Uncharacterized protein n=1 Tax=Streptomyces populi TaxID=2058924 RepID=A0A2I0SLY0_9ACTN|nr:hypothetical protein CW362_21955 [Streptomyces populi]